MAAFPSVPIYLLYGNQHDAILKARDELLAQLLPAELRYDNLTEYYPTTSGDKIVLADQLQEIAGDMATMSFFPGAAKCVVVTNPAEIFSGGGGGGDRPKRKKGDPDALLGWIERSLPETGNHLILLAFEDEAASREVEDKKGATALFQLIQKMGWTRGYREQKAVWRMEEALLRRNLNGFLRALRELWNPGKTDSYVHGQIVRSLRYLMQANIAQDRKLRGEAAAQSPWFPGSNAFNIFKAHTFVQGKYTGERMYQTGDLLRAYGSLLEVYRAMRPRPGDEFVPDALGMLEQTIVTLMNSPRPRR